MRGRLSIFENCPRSPWTLHWKNARRNAHENVHRVTSLKITPKFNLPTGKISSAPFILKTISSFADRVGIFAFARSIFNTNIYNHLNFRRQHEKNFFPVNVELSVRLQITNYSCRYFSNFLPIAKYTFDSNIYCAGDRNKGGGWCWRHKFSCSQQIAGKNLLPHHVHMNRIISKPKYWSLG